MQASWLTSAACYLALRAFRHNWRQHTTRFGAARTSFDESAWAEDICARRVAAVAGQRAAALAPISHLLGPGGRASGSAQSRDLLRQLDLNLL